jgi:type II secretion system protein C
MLSLALLIALAAPSDLTAQGVVVSPHSQHSVALLRSAGRTRVVGTGEMAWGGRVTAISADSVTLDFDGSPVALRLSGGGGGTPLAPPPRPAAPAAAASGPTRTMERRDVERRLGQEVPRILAETVLLPVMDQGAVTGFTLTRIPENSLLSDAGLQAGDVLVSVNDTRIDSMATLMGLWPRLQTENALRAVVVRNGQPVTLMLSLH